ncbi:hypothetical protein QQ020_12005 [Fulvivirgaceae bacterium BMA12]|uniref:Uncharacterized protein n=1 Tax=Agaribacillus aureus TaxID=3051825 RepID=A0ABT8L953_9BACT|nr:hypothetical protein [Fulvivirgaceae bacterium BMA12]
MKKQVQLQFIWVFFFGAIFFGAISFGVRDQVQIGGAIDGEAAFNWLGHSVSLSSDGSVLAIGAPFNDGNGDNSGHVQVYEKVVDALSPGGFKWEQVGGDIDGQTVNDLSGYSVSLSSDGSVLAIGASGVFPFAGHVRVYERDGTADLGWRQVGDAIKGEAAGDRSGHSVSLSSDGSVLAIGAPWSEGNGDFSGHVQVYEKVVDALSPGGFKWEQIGSAIYGETTGDVSGRSVSLSSDGSVLAIGAPLNDGNGDFSGYVRVYEKVADALSPGGFKWEQIGGAIYGEAAGDVSGRSVSLSSDGSVLAIGAPLNDGNGDNSGHVRVYERDGTIALGWRQVGGAIEGEAEEDVSGRSVSLSSDGSVLAIGAPLNDVNGDNSGHVRVYKRDDAVPLGWRQVGGAIYGEAAGDELGSSVSLSADGSVLAIGAPFNDINGFNSGHVRVYNISASGISPRLK